MKGGLSSLLRGGDYRNEKTWGLMLIEYSQLPKTYKFGTWLIFDTPKS